MLYIAKCWCLLVKQAIWRTQAWLLTQFFKPSNVTCIQLYTVYLWRQNFMHFFDLTCLDVLLPPNANLEESIFTIPDQVRVWVSPTSGEQRHVRWGTLNWEIIVFAITIYSTTFLHWQWRSHIEIKAAKCQQRHHTLKGKVKVVRSDPGERERNVSWIQCA